MAKTGSGSLAQFFETEKNLIYWIKDAVCLKDPSAFFPLEVVLVFWVLNLDVELFAVKTHSTNWQKQIHPATQ